eukprot:1186710-Rhodomonas_salina.1
MHRVHNQQNTSTLDFTRAAQSTRADRAMRKNPAVPRLPNMPPPAQLPRDNPKTCVVELHAAEVPTHVDERHEFHVLVHMEGPIGAVLLTGPFLDPPRAGRPPLRCVLPLSHEGVGLGHVPHQPCRCQPHHHELDVCPMVGERVDGPGQLALPLLRAHAGPARLRARSAQSLSTDSCPLFHPDVRAARHRVVSGDIVHRAAPALHPPPRQAR